MNAKLNIILHENQKKIHESKARFKVVKAGKQFGKTKWAIFELCRWAGKKPGGIFWYVAPSYRQAKSIAWHEFKWILPEEYVKRRLETELVIELINGSRIELKGADNEDSLRGIGIDGVVYDEAAYVNEYVHEGIIRSQLMAKKGFAYWISSPNRRGRNWFTNFHSNAKNLGEDWESFYFTTWDNPTIPKEEIQATKDRTTDSTWNLEYMAVESDFAGQIFSEFNDNINIGVYNGTADLPIARFHDWGLVHPSVCLWATIDINNKTVYIIDEMVVSGQIIQQICSQIKYRTGNKPVEWDVIDPSAAKHDPISGRSLRDEYMRWGIPCQIGDRRERGYDVVKMFLKRGMVKINPKCKNLIYELKNLQWGDKTDDDCTDALRYGLVRVHDFVSGMNILTDEHKAIIKDMSKELSFNNPFLFQNARMEVGSFLFEEVD